jgi:hypothetical protein
MWSEGFYDMCIHIDEYLSILEDVPEWVKVSFRNQIVKQRNK